MSVQLFNANCLYVTPWLQSGSVNLVVTSPPYDDLRTYKGYSFEFEKVASELVRVLAPGGVIVWVVGDATVKGSESGTSFRQALYFMSLGLNLHDTMIYHKCPPPTVDIQHHRYYQHWEYMFVLSKGKPCAGELLREPKKYMDNRKRKVGQKKVDGVAAPAYEPSQNTDKVRGNVWYYNVGLHGSTSDREAFNHPAIYPEKLAEDHILSWSKQEDTVFDPFLGSGTTGKMAIINGRSFIGSEISEEYFKIAQARIADAQLAQALKDWERLQA